MKTIVNKRTFCKLATVAPFLGVSDAVASENNRNSTSHNSDHQNYHRSVDPREFGAIADGESHPLKNFFDDIKHAQKKYPMALSLNDEIDWCATQSAFDFCREHVVGGHTQAGQGAPVLNLTGRLKCNRTLFFGTDRAAKLPDRSQMVQKIIGNNCTILSSASNQPAIDTSGNRFYHLEDIHIVGDKSSTPSVGILASRNGAPVKNDNFRSTGFAYNLRIRTSGSFNTCAYYNYGSETDRFEHCRFSVNGGLAKAAVILAASNEENVLGSTQNKQQHNHKTRQSSNWPFFTDCDFTASETPALEAAIIVYGGKRLRIHGGLIDTAAAKQTLTPHVILRADRARNFSPAAMEFIGVLHHRKQNFCYSVEDNVNGLVILNPSSSGHTIPVTVRLMENRSVSKALIYCDEIIGNRDDISGLVFMETA